LVWSDFATDPLAGDIGVVNPVLISVALPPTRHIVDYAKALQNAGAHRLWLYDSPAVYGDIWIALARAAEATSLPLGTAVAVPSLRHPMVTAAAIASIEELAPGRLTVAMGTGYTARRAMGRKPITWGRFATTFTQIRELLAGSVLEIDGRPVQMLHGAQCAPPRPITTPLWIAPAGPMGYRTARELDADGVVLVGIPEPEHRQWPAAALMVNGTVLEPGEDHTSTRVIESAGPWFAAMYHGAWDMNPDLLDDLPGGTHWRATMIGLAPDERRHLAIHRGHLTELGAADLAGITAAGPALLQSGWTGPASSITSRIDQAHQAGITEIIYAPTGPDIIREVLAFLDAAR
jgi:5,10-methylenetetrahydromethanopterin reductase